VNRAQRRTARIRDPKGNYLFPTLLHVVERDAKGRPTLCRVAYDEELIGDVIPSERRDHAEMLLVWMGDAQGFKS